MGDRSLPPDIAALASQSFRQSALSLDCVDRKTLARFSFSILEIRSISGLGIEGKSCFIPCEAPLPDRPLWRGALVASKRRTPRYP